MPAATAKMELVQGSAPVVAAEPDDSAVLTSHDVFVRVGILTRNLHDTLRQLGYDKCVEDAVGALPDARARLDYIANLTGKAAERVLSAAERAKAVQGTQHTEMRMLEQKWSALLSESPNSRAVWDLGRETQGYFVRTQTRLAHVDDELSEIILAQDFHDLTGQVIQRITRLAQSLEEQLVKLLLDTSPPAQRKEVVESMLAGPVISGEGRDDVVTSQSQVDDLLESLGF